LPFADEHLSLRKKNEPDMSKRIIFIAMLFTLLSACSSSADSPAESPLPTVVEQLGPLRVSGNTIIGKNKQPVTLRGMSLFWSQWGARYYNAEVIEWLRDDWYCTVIRAAMAVEEGGYLTQPESERARVETVVDACIDLGIYVIIDWHDHNAEQHEAEAMAFFAGMAEKYGGYDNVIYEIYNEPVHVSWSEDVKPYAEKVIQSIRQHDPDNLIIVGSPTWSQDVDIAVKDPLADGNLAYTLHFYAGTHKADIRAKGQTALNSGFAIFVSEFGLTEASGDGPLDYNEMLAWEVFMENNHISWCNWSISDKAESSAALVPGSSGSGGWSDSELTDSGRYIREKIRAANSLYFSPTETQNE
jgi:endoglucanase